jgi:hypothetical protein
MSTIPVGLAKVGAMAPASLELTRSVRKQAVFVDTQWDCLSDERSLASVRRKPARYRVVLGQTQAHIRMSERREALNARTNGVGELGHHQLDRCARVASGRRSEVDPVGKQGVQLVTHLPIGPLRLSLPASDCLQAGGALERHRLGEAAIENHRGLVNLKRDRDAPLLGDQILLASQGRVEHPDEHLH